jgi:uncharacterized protein
MVKSTVLSRASLPFEAYDQGRVAWLRREVTEDNVLLCGYWRVEPAEMPPGTLHVSQHNESFLVLEGRASLDLADGSTWTLAPGDAASLPPGSEARWTITEPFLEFFVYTSAPADAMTHAAN